MSTELCELAIHELSRRMKAGEITPLDVVASVANRVRAQEPTVNGYITLRLESALDQASAMPQPGPDASPIYGLPIAIKDNICTQGILTTCGSKILGNFVAPYDAFVVERIKAAGGIVIGKTNLDEFAMGASGEMSAWGPTRNPHDFSRVPGGSSAGSAAVVSYGGASAALGSDTGGSVRQPAAFSGVVGLKPTYGRVSRYGLVAFASSLDQIGPITRDVTDAGIMLQVIAGCDVRDATSVDCPLRELELSAPDVREIRIGLPRECFTADLDPRIAAAVQEMVASLGQSVKGICEATLPSLPYAVPVYYLICMAEASSNLARYDGVRYGLRAEHCRDIDEQYHQTRGLGFGDEVKRRILLGTYGLSKGYYDEYYGTGQKVRTMIRHDFENVFREVDVVVMPTAPSVAYKLGEKLEDPIAMYLGDIYTVSASLAGLPAISIPCREKVEGLPVGLQIIGRAFDEATVLRVARACELASNPALQQ